MNAGPRSFNRKPASSWSRTRPTARLVIGIGIVLLVGYLGLTPKTLFGVDMTWPNAALWGAAGWGAIGLAIRPMIGLAIIGLLQDITSPGPIGAYLLVNLAAYGISAWISENFDIENATHIRVAAPAMVVATGYAVLWLLASNSANQAVEIGPLLIAAGATLLLYFPLAPLFSLGRRSDETTG